MFTTAAATRLPASAGKGRRLTEFGGRSESWCRITLSTHPDEGDPSTPLLVWPHGMVPGKSGPRL